MIDRRTILKAGTLGLGLLAFPGAAQLLAARGFTHNVASGEPRPGPGDALDALRAGRGRQRPARLAGRRRSGFRAHRRAGRSDGVRGA